MADMAADAPAIGAGADDDNAAPELTRAPARAPIDGPGTIVLWAHLQCRLVRHSTSDVIELFKLDGRGRNEMERVWRLPIFQCRSRQSGNPVLISIAGITGSPAFAHRVRDDPRD